LKQSPPEIKTIPHLVIEPSPGWKPLDLADLWRYRELFAFLIWRDVKVRYRQTFLGAAWAVLQPLGNMLIFTLLFGRLAGLPSDGIPYPLFAMAGLLPWTFFSGAIGSAASSLVGNAHLITKVYFPRMIIPAAAVLAGLVDLLISLLVMGGLMVWYGVIPSQAMLLLPLLVLLTALIGLGVGMWLAALNVRFRDIRHLLPFLIQLWMFATPVIYPASLMPERYRMVYFINPLSGLIEAWRVALLGGVNGAGFNWSAIGISGGVGMLMLVGAAYDFRRMEKNFADLV
jgi:lipopolysaccharide transport system permease protein